MSTPLWTSAEAAAATGGHNTADWNATSVSIDTRTLKPGALFVALKDARDGHNFVADAFKHGAAAALVSRKPDNVPSSAPLLMVKNTQAGLEALGRASRARSFARIAAITGSVGKTTAKEMLRLAVQSTGRVTASTASYNNHWGVPLSLASMPRDVKFGAYEIGMNHEGEIRALVKQVRPHVALVTTVAPAHLEYFGTVEKIADAKGEIFEGVEQGGTAIVPADNPYAGRLAMHASKAGVVHILYFGAKPDADARLIFAENDGDGQRVIAEIKGERVNFHMRAQGAHIAMNALAVLLAAVELGVELSPAVRALEEFSALKGRGAHFRAGGIEVIDESYNANPVSMAAALQLLAAAKPRARRIAVLGDMLELGAEGAVLHRAIAKDIEAAKADVVFLCGPLMASLWQALPPSRQGAYAKTSSELAPLVVAALRAGDVVLVKGSFGSRMSTVIEALKALGNGGAAAA